MTGRSARVGRAEEGRRSEEQPSSAAPDRRPSPRPPPSTCLPRSIPLPVGALPSPPTEKMLGPGVQRLATQAARADLAHALPPTPRLWAAAATSHLGRPSLLAQQARSFATKGPACARSLLLSSLAARSSTAPAFAWSVGRLPPQPLPTIASSALSQRRSLHATPPAPVIRDSYFQDDRRRSNSRHGGRPPPSQDGWERLTQAFWQAVLRFERLPTNTVVRARAPPVPLDDRKLTWGARASFDSLHSSLRVRLFVTSGRQQATRADPFALRVRCARPANVVVYLLWQSAEFFRSPQLMRTMLNNFMLSDAHVRAGKWCGLPLAPATTLRRPTLTGAQLTHTAQVDAFHLQLLAHVDPAPRRQHVLPCLDRPGRDPVRPLPSLPRAARIAGPAQLHFQAMTDARPPTALASNIGNTRFAGLYLLASVGGSVLSLVSRQVIPRKAPAVGASAGIAGTFAVRWPSLHICPHSTCAAETRSEPPRPRPSNRPTVLRDRVPQGESPPHVCRPAADQVRRLGVGRRAFPFIMALSIAPSSLSSP